MAAKAANMGPELMRFIEKSLLLQVLDAVWKEHLYALDHLRQGIGLRAYGQRDPLNEYKAEAFALFNAMLDELKERVTMMLARVELAPEQPPPVYQPQPMQMMESHPEPVSALGRARAGDGAGRRRARPAAAHRWPVEAQPMRAGAVDPNDPSTWRNAGRNALCPCGSGRKIQALPWAAGRVGRRPAAGGHHAARDRNVFGPHQTPAPGMILDPAFYTRGLMIGVRCVLSPVSLLRRSAPHKKQTPLPSREGVGGRGRSGHHNARPLPPTPSLKGRGEFSYPERPLPFHPGRVGCRRPVATRNDTGEPCRRASAIRTLGINSRGFPHGLQRRRTR